MKIRLLIIAILFFFINSSVHAQGWEKVYGEYARAYDVLPASDGTYYITGISPDGLGAGFDFFSSFIMKLNANGEKMWHKIYPEETGLFGGEHLLEHWNNTFIFKTRIHIDINGESYSKNKFNKLDADGNVLWEYELWPTTESDVVIRNVYINPDGSIIFITSNDTGRYIGKIDGDGNELFLNELNAGITETKLQQGEDNRYFITDKDAIDGHLKLIEIEEDGTITYIHDFPDLLDVYKVFFIENNDFVFFRQVDNFTTVIQHRMNLQGDTITADTIHTGNTYVVENNVKLEDGFTTTGWSDPSDPTFGILSIRTDFDGNIIWSKKYAHRPGASVGYRTRKANDGGYVITGNYLPLTNGFGGAYILKTDENGDVYTNVVSGNVAIDEVSDCIVTEEDTPLEDWIISAKKDDLTFLTTSDANGDYVLPIDTGAFTISLFSPSVYWAPCANDLVLDFTDFDNESQIDFAVNPLVDCPSMAVSGTAAAIRPCFVRPSHVNYNNYGTSVAEDAYIEITYDSFITPVSSSIPWDSLGGNVYRFNLGDIDPLASGSFTVDLFLDCEATVGASYCIEAHAYPDTDCTPPLPSWSGAFLEVSGTCEGDNIYFKIENTGTAAMDQYSDYIIVEDVILMMMDSVNLDSGEFEDLPVLANGATYTIVAEQVPDAPGFSNPIAVVEGCGENGDGEFSVGFSNQFALNDENPYYDIDCPIATDSYDPNDKQGFPVGYGEEHFIRPERSIEYLIRFQNTGTDTAFTVVIKDTLDTQLEVSSFRAGASSHDYDFDISGEGILTFSFENIMLPDSNVNEVASNGFVEFKITPRFDLELGSVIKNQAAIYFDFNDPIFTNETFHTLGEEFIDVMVGTIEHPIFSNISVLVHPNPFVEQVVFDIKNHSANNYELEVFDSSGRLIRQEQYTTAPITFERKSMARGLYFYRLSSKDGFSNIGRMIVH